VKTPVTMAPEALDFTQLIRAGETIGWAEATAEPVFLTRLLDAQAERCPPFRVFFALTFSDGFAADHPNVTVTALGGASAGRRFFADRADNVMPANISDISGLVSSGRLPIAEDSASFRAFARLPLAWSPKKSVLHQTISAIRPESWEAVNRAVLASAKQDRLESGATVRIDSTVPSASALLWDAVRIMTRLLRQAAKLPGAPALQWRDRRRLAKKRARAIE
jgi:hypothetical protein